MIVGCCVPGPGAPCPDFRTWVLELTGSSHISNSPESSVATSTEGAVQRGSSCAHAAGCPTFIAHFTIKVGDAALNPARRVRLPSGKSQLPEKPTLAAQRWGTHLRGHQVGAPSSSRFARCPMSGFSDVGSGTDRKLSHSNSPGSSVATSTEGPVQRGSS